MERLILNDLLEWKKRKNRKPLVLQGARQVGKTWILREFGNRFFQDYVYINFESSSHLQRIFKDDFNIARLITILEIETGKTIQEETLIILDEIQEAHKGLTALKYFHENAPQYFIAAAGSFLGVSIQKQQNFPVGKVDLLTLYPLSFEEFLLNDKDHKLLSLLKEKKQDILLHYHDKLISKLRTYYFVGGMPEALNSFLETNNFNEVRRIQNNILIGYENDFAKYAPIEIVPKIRMVWKSILGQLSKENKKFIYGQLKHGARAKEFESAINWLVNSGLIYKCFLVENPVVPLKSYANFDTFKLYFSDIGLLNASAGVSEQILIHQNKILVEYKGALTEQYVAQQLMNRHELFYWAAPRATAEVDFVIQKDNQIIPLEVKAEENLKSKSLKVFMEKYHPELSVKTSMSFFKKQDHLENIPLYAIGYL
jgi:predicted AAA+ superfamily ATPase